ncbi:hypothetical protein EON65_00765 [archaeon]|nr:MAG: hypothetical protein EON65_00765 [archaeon]
MEEKGLDEKLVELGAHPNIKCSQKKELLEEHAATWQHNGLSSFRESEQFKVIRTECLTPHAIKISVELSYNSHWTDQKCIE